MDQQFDQNNAVFRSRKPVKFLDFNQISQKIVQSHASSSNGFEAKIQKPEPKKITTIENCVIPDDLVFSSDTNSSQKISTPLPKARKKLRNQRGEVVQINNNQSSEGGAHFADYHKFTWGVSPESSIASGSGQQALRKELEKAELLLNQSIERYRSLTSEVTAVTGVNNLEEVKMKTGTKDAIRNEFRALLEEHDCSGTSCTTSVNSMNSNSPPPNGFVDLNDSSQSPDKWQNQSSVMNGGDAVGTSGELKCPLCNLRVTTSLFTPVVLLPCQHVICEVCADLRQSSPLTHCPACSCVVATVQKASSFLNKSNHLVNQSDLGCGDDISTSVADASCSSVTTVLTTDSDTGSARVEPTMSDAEQLFFIREVKFKKQMNKLEVEKEQIVEAENAVARQLESIQTEESKVMQEIHILEEKLHHLRILKEEHSKTLDDLVQKEDKINVRQFLVQRSLDSIEFQRLEQEIVNESK
ncbi:uncharacterized protein LOC134851122 [Symsagittifera roscoffensis]|uniref:uncharacterized protein LOC134851122 n=1 Tax=Symsagittifera roscoffensis TaxID=84072 RepID=UPI00307B217B